MEDGTLGEDINPWGVALFGTLQGVELELPVEEAAYGKWLDQTSTREQARQDRIHGAAGVMPTPMWIALFFISAIVLAYLFGFADSSERAWVQALFMGSVVSVIVTMLLLLHFLDEPFQVGVGGLQPDAMERTEMIIDQQLAALGGGSRSLRPGWQPDVTATTTTAAGGRGARRDWVEIVATVLLALAAVATAWSSYQANRRNGEQTKTAGRVNGVRIDAAVNVGGRYPALDGVGPARPSGTDPAAVAGAAAERIRAPSEAGLGAPTIALLPGIVRDRA